MNSRKSIIAEESQINSPIEEIDIVSIKAREIAKNITIENMVDKFLLYLTAIASKWGAQEPINQVYNFFADKICEFPHEKNIIILSKPAPYIGKIFKHYLIDINKTKKTYIGIEKVISIKSIQQDDFIMEDEIKEFQRKIAIKFKNPNTVTIFNRVIEGYTNPEIAKELGMSTKTIGTIRHRIRKFLREC